MYLLTSIYKEKSTAIGDGVDVYRTNIRLPLLCSLILICTVGLVTIISP